VYPTFQAKSEETYPAKQSAKKKATAFMVVVSKMKLAQKIQWGKGKLKGNLLGSNSSKNQVI
jgi:hypothetical protein